MKKLIAITVILILLGLIYSALRVEPSSLASAAPPVQGQIPVPIRQREGLQSLTFWERTGGQPTAITFSVNSSPLVTRRNELHASSHDFTGASTEFYDVFYSNADGTVNADGAFVTVEAVWNFALPAGGGLNIAEVQLDFTPGGRPPVFGNTVASFVGLGDNFVPASVANAADGNLQTTTVMGNTAGQTQRLRVTIGFPPPEPPPGPSLVILDVEVGEGDSGTTNAVFRVGVNGTPAAAVSADFATANFGAVAGSDYLSRTGTLTIPLGQQSANINVPVIGDTLPERPQSFFVRLSNPRGATIQDGEGVGVIGDDDEPGTITACSQDTPITKVLSREAGNSIESTIGMDRDLIVDDYEVKLFVSNQTTGGVSLVDASLRSPSSGFKVLFSELEVPAASGIGTGCLPSPDCVIGYGNALRLEDHNGEAPYVGRWQIKQSEPFIAEKIEGRNARGPWKLDVGRALSEMRTMRLTLECWCLSLTGSREGLSLKPSRTVAPIINFESGLEDPFKGHTVKALVNDNGRPVENVPVTFKVVNKGGQGDVILTAVEATDSDGMAYFNYLNWVAGEDTIEARAEVNGAIYTDIARVSWINPCAATQSLQGTADQQATLNAMREFRDSKLAKSKRGQDYARLYYKFSGEAIRLMLMNPMMVLRSQEMIESYIPIVRDLTAGKEAALTEGDLQEIEGFMNDFAAKGSAELKQTVKNLCEDLRDSEAQRELGLSIRPGPKRGLTASGQPLGLRRASLLTIYCGLFLGGIFLIRWARRKGSRIILCVVLALLISSSQWPPTAPPLVSANLRPMLSGASSAPSNSPLAFATLQGSVDTQRLDYSTYLGAGGDDQGVAVAADAEGNLYVAGMTDSTNLPTVNAVQPNFGGGAQDAFVAKLDPTGTRLIYLTYLGGSGTDTATGLAVDASGNAYLTGFTSSPNFPALNALQANNRGNFDAFIAKLGPTGNLLYSTYLGGTANDSGGGIAVDVAGNAYVAGIATSTNFPVVSAAQPNLSGASDLYVAKLNAAGNQLLYSTYLGGSQDDAATAVAVDASGNAYVTGATLSTDFRTANAAQPAPGGGLFDALVVKLNPSGNLVYSTYLGGGNADRGLRIAADATGAAYVTGDTRSTNFPMRSALQQTFGGSSDAFVTKLNANGSLAFSTYLGGGGLDGGTAISVDPKGATYLTGFTNSINFPTLGPLQPALSGGSFDGFIAKLNPAGSGLDFSTYLGGSGLDTGYGISADSSGQAYLMGVTDSPDFPLRRPLQPAHGGGPADLFVAKIKSSGPAISRAEIQGKHLLVCGSGFDLGAKILINGEVHKKTRNDEQNPGGQLFGKKAGKLIERGETVTLQVRNADGSLSNELSFTRP
jgi:hypothetical protein